MKNINLINFLKNLRRWKINSLPQEMDNIHSDAEHAALVRKSDLFDEKWYFKKYNNINIQGMDAALHYVRHGAAEGRDPSQFFCTNAYWKQNPDVKAAGMNPLVHYLVC